MIKVLRKVLGVTIYAGGLLFAVVVLVGGLVAKCVWFMTCAIAEGGR
jgi:hypothetical protein